MQAGSEGVTPSIGEVGAIPKAPEIGSSGSGELGSSAAGLAKGLEAALATPDIGIQKIAEVSTPDVVQSPMGTPEESPLIKPSGTEVPGKASEPGAPVITGAENGTGPAAKREAEIQAPTGEAAKVPGKVANNAEFKKTWGDLYASAKQQGDVDLAEIDRQALTEYYDNGAKSQVEKGLPDEIKKDPLYQQNLGEAMTNAQDNGEPLDANKLSQEALSKYQQEKDLQVEEAEGPKAEQLKTDESLEDVAKRLSDLLENNEAILESTKVTISAKDLALLLKALAEGKEPDPKKKESVLAMLLRILMIMGLSTFEEAGKQAEQEATRRR